MTGRDEPTDAQFEALVKRAEQSVADLRQEFETENERNVTALRNLWLMARELKGPTPQREGLFRVCHDIKGQGATFGYQLLSMIAESLCDLLIKQREKEITDRLAALIEAHVAAIELVTQRKLTGPGGPQEKELLHHLKRARSAIDG